MSDEITFKNYDQPLIANLEQLTQLLSGKSALGLTYFNSICSRIDRENGLIPLPL
jgi:hypothetical protein